VLDVMIHDLDIVLHLAGSDVKSLDATGVCVLSDKEDLVNARLVFENGCVANLTASRISASTIRKVRAFQHSSYLSLDCLKKEAWVYRKSGNFAGLPALLAKAKDHPNPEQMLFDELIDMKQVTVEDRPPLEAELASFAQCVRDGSRPLVSGVEGRRAVAAAEMITNAMHLHTH
jgi:predicted dehydrogenase